MVKPPLLVSSSLDKLVGRCVMCRVTSLAGLSYTQAKLSAAMRQSISAPVPVNILSWLYAFSHLPRLKAAKPTEHGAKSLEVPGDAGDGKGEDASADLVYVLTQEWISRVVQRMTDLIATLHQVRSRMQS